TFTVPRAPACQAQLLRLEAAGEYPHERVFSGGLWFDELVLAPKSHLTTAVARAFRSGQGE
ncbi:MAG TPA: hypothetical protein PLN94_12180, partial [Thiolinea sp.]|nr:hypothetical protein [Thiolinea sp.]